MGKSTTNLSVWLGAALLLAPAGPLFASAVSTNAPSAGGHGEKAEPIRLSFDTLRSWTYIEGKTAIPDSIKKLDGEPVEMVGFMMPLTQTKDISEFVLMPYLFGCCYGQPPAASHVVLVTMSGGHKTKFIPDVIRVVGIFHAGEMREDGYLVSLYRLDCETIKRPAPRLPHVGDFGGPN